MNNNKDRISELLFLEAIGKLPDEGRKELQQWRETNASNAQLYEEMTDTNVLEEEYRLMKSVNTERPMKAFKDRIRRQRKEKTMTLMRRAAVVAAFIGIGAISLFISRNNQQAEPVVAQQTLPIEQSVGKMKATLTTSDGDVLNLGENEQENSKLLSKISNGASEARNILLNVPRGGEFKIELEDGTEVWLNSESRLTYPEHFGETDRKVSVTGEAFFKVKRDEKRPFLVETDGQVVQVLGTEFNVKSYSEDADVQTTLVSGSIALSRKGDESKQLTLTPGHQSTFDKKDLCVNVKSVDTEIVTSWRNGQFVFEHQNLQQIMQVLSRWYTFDYTFAGPDIAQMEFMGSIPRYSNLGTALTILEKSGQLKCSIKGNRVEISRRRGQRQR